MGHHIDAQQAAERIVALADRPFGMMRQVDAVAVARAFLNFSWQPIATAPKDRVIIFTDGASARWLDSWCESMGGKNWTLRLNRAVKATLWADMPAFPEAPRG